MNELEKRVWMLMQVRLGWDNEPEGLQLEFFRDTIKSVQELFDIEKRALDRMEKVAEESELMKFIKSKRKE